MLSYWCVLLFNTLHVFRTTIAIAILVKQNINEDNDQLDRKCKCLQEQIQRIRQVVYLATRAQNTIMKNMLNRLE